MAIWQIVEKERMFKNYEFLLFLRLSSGSMLSRTSKMQVDRIGLGLH